MINSELFLRFGAALIIGILIGLQREHAYGGHKEEGLFAGVRTFAMMALFGSTTALIGQLLDAPWVFLGLVIILGIMIIIAYFITPTERKEIGLTSEVAALLTILIGGISYLHSVVFAAALGVATTVLLAVKWEMRKRIDWIVHRKDRCYPGCSFEYDHQGIAGFLLGLNEHQEVHPACVFSHSWSGDCFHVIPMRV